MEALDAGADDYLTKPFGVSELLARMRAWRCGTRARRPRAGGRCSRSGALRIDLARREVYARRARGAASRPSSTGC